MLCCGDDAAFGREGMDWRLWNGLNKIRHMFRMFLLSMFGPGFDVLAQHPNIRLATEAKCPMAR
jgi:hypothetical protein